MDKVFIQGLEVEGVIGIFQWEREVRQNISVDLEMDFDNKRAAKSDSIDDALNYKKVGKRITSYIENSTFKLVESLAENIAKIILKEFPVSKVCLSMAFLTFLESGTKRNFINPNGIEADAHV